MRKLIGLLVLSVCVSWTSMSWGSTITVNAQDYEITTVTGFYRNYIDILEDQVWWGDSSLAQEFANTLGVSMGTPNSSYLHAKGPAFGYSKNTFSGGHMNAWAYGYLYEQAYDVNACCVYWTYATATPVVSPVPLPAAAWLFGSALLGLIGYSRCKGAKNNA